MDGEAFLGELPPGLRVIQDPLDRSPPLKYLSAATGEEFSDDPRLGPLPQQWERIDYERTADDPMFVDYFRNTATGEVINSDPRWSVEALKARGVKLETFDIV
jgi:hypothetical protein